MTGPFKHCQLMIASVCLLAAIEDGITHIFQVRFQFIW
jgi:hypothetical protein